MDDEINKLMRRPTPSSADIDIPLETNETCESVGREVRKHQGDLTSTARFAKHQPATVRTNRTFRFPLCGSSLPHSIHGRPRYISHKHTRDQKSGDTRNADRLRETKTQHSKFD